MQYNEINKSIDILCDTKGIDILINALTRLRGTNGHVHFYGGQELDLSSPRGGEVFGELVIDAVLPENP